jgi:hypothetical protein
MQLSAAVLMTAVRRAFGLLVLTAGVLFCWLLVTTVSAHAGEDAPEPDLLGTVGSVVERATGDVETTADRAADVARELVPEEPRADRADAVPDRSGGEAADGHTEAPLPVPEAVDAVVEKPAVVVDEVARTVTQPVERTASAIREVARKPVTGKVDAAVETIAAKTWILRELVRDTRDVVDTLVGLHPDDVPPAGSEGPSLAAQPEPSTLQGDSGQPALTSRSSGHPQVEVTHGARTMRSSDSSPATVAASGSSAPDHPARAVGDQPVPTERPVGPVSTCSASSTGGGTPSQLVATCPVPHRHVVAAGSTGDPVAVGRHPSPVFRPGSSPD